MGDWEDPIREDHRTLESQAQALETALGIDLDPQDRQVVLLGIVRTLGPALELHLRKEEEILFPALKHLLAGYNGAMTTLQDEHHELRGGLRRLAETVQEGGLLDWERIRSAGRTLMRFLEEHEKKQERLLLDILRYSLNPQELEALTKAFQEVAEKAYTQEGWPRPWKGESNGKTMG